MANVKFPTFFNIGVYMYCVCKLVFTNPKDQVLIHKIEVNRGSI